MLMAFQEAEDLKLSHNTRNLHVRFQPLPPTAEDMGAPGKHDLFRSLQSRVRIRAPPHLHIPLFTAWRGLMGPFLLSPLSVFQRGL